MKAITNWRQASVADFEADNLLHGVTMMHVMSYKIVEMNGEYSKEFTIRRDDPNYVERVAKFFKHHIDKGIPVVMHNGIGYDVRMVEKVLKLDLSKLMVMTPWQPRGISVLNVAYMVWIASTLTTVLPSQ